MDLADIEQFALENLNEHKKGILGKSVPIGNMLAWTKVCYNNQGMVHNIVLLAAFEMIIYMLVSKKKV